MSIIKRFITNLKTRPRIWKFAWGVAAVGCIVLSFKGTVISNLFILACWAIWAWSIYGDWENK